MRFVGNLVFLAGRWADLFASVRFPKVLGMFVLGLWTVRTGLALAPAAHQPHAGALVPARLGRRPAGEPHRGVGLRTVALPAAVSGSAARRGDAGCGHSDACPGLRGHGRLLVVDGRRLIGLFAPLGRMALTNYLMHSII
jgi:hypothetical protein